MKHIKFIKYYALIFLLIGGGTTGAQSVLNDDQSAALKTIRTVDDIPVVYQDEVKGGYHQYAGDPWGDTIPEERIYKGMLSHNTITGVTYRYIGTSFDASDIATQNLESDWERVYFVTQHNPNGIYKSGEVVVDGPKLFQANADIDGSGSAVSSSDPQWTALSADDQQLQSFIVDNDSIRLTLEDGGNVAIALDEMGSDDQQLQSFVVDNDSIRLTLEDGGNVAIALTELGSDDQQLQSFVVDNDSIRLTLEDGGKVS
ncbi:MAG: hypothetical protein PF444_01465, partial [Bacteroidales bacterium]|nr:hypothetical protein [Bacteroidales bacterium]